MGLGRRIILLGAVFIGGITVFGGLNGAMRWTNTEEFCISCHEMKQNAYEEFKLTAHDLNQAGVRATCADCHVPREWLPMLTAKLRASKDLVGHFLGTIDTKQKYDAKRLIMAETVWNALKKTDSRECRGCHTLEAMALDEQTGRARRKHAAMRANGQTCIDCHKGIAHRLPERYEEDF